MTIRIENQYLAPVYCYSALIDCTNVIIPLYDRYERRSFRNRCIVSGANGPVTLSVPMEGGRNQKSLARDIRIANRYNWQHDHWKTIESCYRRTPWFEDIASSLEIFFHKEFVFLHDLNLGLFEVIERMLKIPLQPIFENNPGDIPVELDLRNRITPVNYQHVPCMTYNQVFQEKHGFLPNLSIIDLLFCAGPASSHFLTHNKESFVGLM